MTDREELGRRSLAALLRHPGLTIRRSRLRRTDMHWVTGGSRTGALPHCSVGPYGHDQRTADDWSPHLP